MSTATYTVTNETRAALASYIEDLIDVAAKGQAGPGSWHVSDIEWILENGVYEPVSDEEEDEED